MKNPFIIGQRVKIPELEGAITSSSSYCVEIKPDDQRAKIRVYYPDAYLFEAAQKIVKIQTPQIHIGDLWRDGTGLFVVRNPVHSESGHTARMLFQQVSKYGAIYPDEFFTKHPYAERVFDGSSIPEATIE